MTPREFLSAGPARPQWVHGSDVGMDEKGGLWVRASAELMPDLEARVAKLGSPVPAQAYREFSILTAEGKTALSKWDRSEPIWDSIQELRTSSIGTEWVAVC